MLYLIRIKIRLSKNIPVDFKFKTHTTGPKIV